MGFFDKMQDWMSRVIEPVATKIAANNVIKALQSGMMLTVPISIGAVIITILTNLPIDGWTNFLYATGLYSIGMQLMLSTLSMLAIYIVIAVSYSYTKILGQNPITGALLSTAVFITLMPQFISTGESTLQALASSNLGSDGMFVAMIVGIVVPWCYNWLMKHHVTLKLPASVPPMVTESLSPVFVAIITFTVTFFVKYGISLTSYGDIFQMINTLVATPVMSIGASPWAIILVYAIVNLFWFFGIHPSAITSVYMPVMTSVSVTLAEQFAAGEPLNTSYAVMMILTNVFLMGGTGNTLGMVVQGCFAKSDQYKSLSRLAVVPSFFNINEPIIFGYPMMLNPIFFIPMLLVVPVTGVVVIALTSLFGIGSFNPAIQMPWATPTVLTAFLQGGFYLLLIFIVAIAIQWLIYFPFFKMADNQAYKEEQAAAAAEAAAKMEIEDDEEEAPMPTGAAA